eukprot:UN30033
MYYQHERKKRRYSSAPGPNKKPFDINGFVPNQGRVQVNMATTTLQYNSKSYKQQFSNQNVYRNNINHIQNQNMYNNQRMNPSLQQPSRPNNMIQPPRGSLSNIHQNNINRNNNNVNNKYRHHNTVPTSYFNRKNQANNIPYRGNTQPLQNYNYTQSWQRRNNGNIHENKQNGQIQQTNYIKQNKQQIRPSGPMRRN